MISQHLFIYLSTVDTKTDLHTSNVILLIFFPSSHFPGPLKLCVIIWMTMNNEKWVEITCVTSGRKHLIADIWYFHLPFPATSTEKVIYYCRFGYVWWSLHQHGSLTHCWEICYPGHFPSQQQTLSSKE